MRKGIIFDFDGVIVDSEHVWREAEMEVFRRAGHQLTAEKVASNSGKKVEDLVAEHQKQFSFNEAKAKQLIKDIYTYVQEEMNKNPAATPGLYQAVDFFLSRNYKLAIASSSPINFIKKVLKNLSLADVFNIICSGQDEEYAKPHPAVYLAACKKLELQPSQVIAIEDSLTGLISAKAAKIFCILLKEEKSRLPVHQLADCILTDLTEISSNKVI